MNEVQSIPNDHAVTPWWGSFKLEVGQTGQWKVGPTTFTVTRLEREWQVQRRAGDDPIESVAEVTIPFSEEERSAENLEETDEETERHRFCFQRTSDEITVMPALADRAVVSTPESPLHIPSGQELTIYLSTPVWVQLSVDKPSGKLHEFPSYRMSDTWFGSSTREGELCYATTTAGRTNLENLPQRLHRAVTPVRVQNKVQDVLVVERVQLPVQYLSIYQSADSHLWTQGVELVWTSPERGASVEIGQRAPKEARQAKLLTKARQEVKSGLAVSTFSAIGSLFT